MQNDDGRWLVFTATHGWASTDVFALDTRTKGATPITIAKDMGARFYPRFVKDELWMRTDLGRPPTTASSPSTCVSRPVTRSRRTVIAEQPEVIEDVTVIDSTMYAQVLKDAASHILRFDMQGRRAGGIEVPPMSSASIRGDGPGHALLTLESFAMPETTWRLDLATGARTIERGPEIPFTTARTCRCAMAP